MRPRELVCKGRVLLGRLDAESEQRLTLAGGEWLEYSPEEQAVVVRHVQPGGSPALAAVPAELIALLDLLPDDRRAAMPGGMLVVRDRDDVVLRLVVEAGEIHVQWPHEDWEHAVELPTGDAFRLADPFAARVSGVVEFAAPAGAEQRLAGFVENYEGLYPEGELVLGRRGGRVTAELRSVNVGPEELVRELRALADPPESLEADLEIGSFGRPAIERDFRLRIHGGETRALRPALWPEPAPLLAGSGAPR